MREYHVSGERIKSRWSIKNRSAGTTASFNENLIEIELQSFKSPQTESEGSG